MGKRLDAIMLDIRSVTSIRERYEDATVTDPIIWVVDLDDPSGYALGCVKQSQAEADAAIAKSARLGTVPTWTFALSRAKSLEIATIIQGTPDWLAAYATMHAPPIVAILCEGDMILTGLHA